MDDQSFELLMSKLDGLENGQTRIEDNLTKRLDQHYELVEKHIVDDKLAWAKLDDIATEVKVAKRIAYTMTTALGAAATYLGWHK